MPTILFESGPERGGGVELREERSYTLGRGSDCDVVIPSDLASRRHCQIKSHEGGWYIRDLDSRNGLLVNDRRIERAQLRYGDKLQIGDMVLSFLEEQLAHVHDVRMLAGYQLRGRIGRGATGTVYRALQMSLQREVALKVLSPDLGRDAKFVARFVNEARAAGQLNHPNIVQVHDVGSEGGDHFYSMEFVPGGSVQDRLQAEGTIPVDEAIWMAVDTAMALEYAESRGIVHRDVKPDNLMLTEQAEVKLADLGLAMVLSESTLLSEQPILGTPHFISPEQVLRQDVDIRADIYSLGATLYRMLSGATVHQGSNAREILRKVVKEQPAPLLSLAPQVPERVAAVVHRMLEKDPAQRYANASELREALELLTEEEERPAPPPSHAPRVRISRRARRRGPAPALVIGPLLLGIVALMVWLNAPEMFRGLGKADEGRGDTAAVPDEDRLPRTGPTLEQSLDSARSYLDIAQRSGDATATRSELRRFLGRFAALATPETQDAQAHVALLDALIPALQERDFRAALGALRDLGPRQSDAARRQAVAEIEQVAGLQFDELQRPVQRALEREETEDLIRACNAGLACFGAPDPSFPRSLARQFELYRGWFQDRKPRGD